MASYEELKAEIKGRECITCHSQPRVAWRANNYNLRCNCFPHKPKLYRQPDRLGRRLGDMMAQDKPEAERALTTPLEGTLVPVSAPAPMTIQEFDEQQRLVEHIVAEMKENVHFGLIPGTHDKSLWEPGAEYLRRAFRIVWAYDIVDEFENFKDFEFRYTVRTYQLHAPGVRGSGWTASAWSKEKRFGKMDGHDLQHNVRDRAIKRAFVALIRNLTGTTGYFKIALDTTNNGQSTEKQVTCPDHNKPMTLRDGKYGPYYSHKEGSKWCNKKPDQVAEPRQPAPEPPVEAPQSEASPEPDPQAAWTEVYQICSNVRGMAEKASEWVKENCDDLRCTPKYFSGNPDIQAGFPVEQADALARYLDQVATEAE